MKNGNGRKTTEVAANDTWVRVLVTTDPHKLGALKRCRGAHLRAMAEAKQVEMERDSATETGQRDNPYAVTVRLIETWYTFSITSRYLDELSTAQREHAGLPADHASQRMGRTGWTDQAAENVFVAGVATPAN